MNSGTMKTRGAKMPRKTWARYGSCFQNASCTWAKILRRRNSSACWQAGAAESAFTVEPCPTSTRAASEKFSLTSNLILICFVQCGLRLRLRLRLGTRNCHPKKCNIPATDKFHLPAHGDEV